ncbi:helix-turn-helix domain-containing protein [Cerasicoccus maritimus]|uniref:helix-turn-helix domain-containing protein n=1 Tax=Cerasicoccus maritimus TaxID=490089 RepID=UPI0028528970|nr:helix-turn-helix domain-containing protein [Cerasicoccus maritimus]
MMNTTTDTDLRAQPPVLMNEREISVFLGLSERSVRTYTTNGLIPVIRVGRRKIFRRDAVLAALRKLES